MRKIIELLYKREQFLKEGETLILVSDGKFQVLSCEVAELIAVNGDANKKIMDFLELIKEESR